jgi:predicted metal-dependent hydrolase
MRSDYRLKKQYRAYNQKYFGGKLPDVWVRWAEDNDDLKSECQAKKLLACADGHGIIFNPWMKGKRNLQRFTLLHEMVHVKYPEHYHGPRFQKEMMRLAKLGAFAKLW